LVNPKTNHANLQEQNEGADYQYSDRPHGCEVPSEEDNFGSVFMISEKFEILLIRIIK
jgi:hypothetical protein